MTTKKETKDERNIYQRMAAAMGNVSYVQKDTKVNLMRKDGSGSGGSYRAVSHDAVTAKVRPALLAEGIYYHPSNLVHKQNGNRTEVSLDLIFVNIADPKDTLSIPCLGYGVDSQDKGPGKAISYAVKYGLLKGLGLETGDDADNESVEHVQTITADQFFELKAKIELAGVDADKITSVYNIESLEVMPKDVFPKAMHKLGLTIKSNEAAPKDGSLSDDQKFMEGK